MATNLSPGRGEPAASDAPTGSGRATPAPRADLLDALFALARAWPLVWRLPDVAESVTSVVRCFRNPSPGRGDVDAAGLTVGEVAQTLCVAPSTASRLVDAAVRSGHVTKAPHPRLPRSTSVRLTEHGRDLLDRLLARERSWLDDATPGWSARQRWQARQVVLELAGGLRDRVRPPA